MVCWVEALALLKAVNLAMDLLPARLVKLPVLEWLAVTLWCAKN